MPSFQQVLLVILFTLSILAGNLLFPLISSASDLVSFAEQNRCAAFFAFTGNVIESSPEDASSRIVKIQIPAEMRQMYSLELETSGLFTLEMPFFDGRFKNGMKNVINTDEASSLAPAEESLRYAPNRTKTVRAGPSHLMIITSASQSMAERFNRLHPFKSLMPQGAVEFDMTEIQTSFAERPINYFSSGINEYALTPSNTLAPREAPALKFQNRVIIDNLPIGALQQIANLNSNMIRVLLQTLERKDPGLPQDKASQDLKVAYVNAGFSRSARLEITGENSSFYSHGSQFVLAEYDTNPTRAADIVRQMGRADLVVDFVGLASRRPLGEVLKFFYEALNEGGYAVLFIPTEFKGLQTGEPIEFVKFFGNPRQESESTPFSLFNHIPGFKLKNLFKRSQIMFSSLEVGAKYVRLPGPTQFNGVVVYLQKDSTYGDPSKIDLGIKEVNSSGMRFLSLEHPLHVMERE